MTNLAEYLLPRPDEPRPRWRWATVTGVAPVRIRLDGDTSPLTVTPDVLGSVEIGDRVYCQVGRRVVVFGSGRGLRWVAGVIRNDGSPDYWQPIENATHTSLNVDSVTTEPDRIYIDYSSLGASKVISFIAAADETLVSAGIMAGTSVGVESTYIKLSQPAPFADFVQYTGTAWESANGVFTPTYTQASGQLRLDHPAMPVATATEVYNHTVTGRGDLLASSHGANADYCIVRWHDYAGNLVTTPSTNQRAFVTQGTSGILDAQALDTTLYPSSNIWFMGLLET